MKRTTKNKKVIQAITIGLAAMITATSTPIEVLAEDENNNIENNQSQSNENNQSNEASVSQTASDCAEIISENNNQIDAASDAINNASTAVNNIATISDQQQIAVPETLATIQSELQEGATDIANAGGDLQIAVQAFNDALVADLNTDKAVNLENSDSAINNVLTAENKINDFNDTNKSTTENSNNAINQANVANTSGSKDEAYAAKDKAVEELNNAEKGLETAEKAYGLASEAVSQAQTKYDAAIEEQKKAVEKLNEAKAKLNDANTNATAANEMLKAAQTKMDQLDSEVTRLAQSKADLEALQNQYYKLMVHFYRDNKINSAVYNEEGKLDIAASAAKAEKNGKFENTSATENTMKIGRELMKDLVMYKLKANGAENIQFAVQENGLTKKESADGELVKDAKGNDRVTIEETQDQYWDYPSGDDGRHHNVKVTYTITLEDGTKKEIIEYYNYIYKAKKYNDNMDMINGPIYLANINPETGTVDHDTDVNNMDNFVKLGEEINKAIDAVKILNEYNTAKKAVDDTQSLVDNLNKTIKTLSEKDLKFNENKLDELKKELENAKELLKTAKADKEVLEEKVEEARKAVAAIDLSRFNESDDDREDAGSSSETPSTTPGLPSTIPASFVSTYTESAPVTTSTGTTTTGTGLEAPAAGVAGAKVDPETTKTEKETPKLVKIGDNEIPLADMPELNEEYSIFGWIGLSWLLLLLAYIIYKLSKNKQEKDKELENKKEQ